jgi:hypothetical protein
MTRQIGEIYNHDGVIHTKKEGELFYWMLESISQDLWEEIPKYLYDALNKFEDEREK